MNRRSLYAAALAAALAGCAELPPKPEEYLASKTVRYACPDGTRFVAEFDDEVRTVRLTFSDRQVTLLRRASTDAFVRFGDGRTAFATSGRDAAVADQIRVVHADCRAE